MIDALIQGKLHQAPQQRIGKTGKPFVTAKLTTTTKDGDSAFVNCITFNLDVCRALMALAPGDSVALSGELTPSVYHSKEGQPRISLDLTAHAALSAYHTSRKRQAMRPPAPQPANTATPPPDYWPPADAPYEF